MCTICAMEARPPLVMDCLEMESAVNGSPNNDTIAGSTRTTATLSDGQAVSGYINTLGDQDWYRITVTAGETYVFEQENTSGSNLDSLLRLYDANGTQIAENDDVAGGNLDSRITYTFETGGTYYIAADSFGNSGVGSGTGQYRLTMGETEPVPAGSIAELADYLVEGYWQSGGGGARSWQAQGDITVNLAGLTDEQANLARLAMELWEDVADIEFREINRGSADITFQNTDTFNAYSSSVLSGRFITSNVINIGSGWNGGNTDIEGDTLTTYIHEIGHSLGLGHQGPYNGNATYGSDNVFAKDSLALSVMSYFGQNEANTGDRAQVYTPQIVDVVAIQDIYGAATDVRSGNTIYGGANENVGGALGTILDNVTGTFAFTINDTGGTDLVDAQEYSDAQTLDLREGRLSSIGGLTNNVGIAIGTVIENAAAGSGNDLLIGNDAANRLIGNGGNDRLLGGNGNDRLYGGDGIDELRGGNGVDVLLGNAGDDRVFGDNDDDRVYGQEGNDRLYGGDGADILFGGDGIDVLLGNEGSDRLLGENGDDRLYGQDGNDRLYGQEGNDLLLGGEGGDVLLGNEGNDALDGENGNDRVYGQDGNDRVFGGAGGDRVDGGAGNDALYGGSGSDLMIGGSGGDLILGQTGNDVLRGDAGNDILDGGVGNDVLAGGTGGDQFRFTDEGGNDRILDFDPLQAGEVIDLSRVSSITSYRDLVANHLEQVNGELVITYQGDNGASTIVVGDVPRLSADDFLF